MPKDINNVGSTNANKVFDLPLQLQPGQVNTLSFSQDSISSMHLTPKNELEVSFRDGSKIVIENFDELANSAMSCGRDTIIQLSDNTIIYPDQLRDQLAQKGGVDFTNQEGGVIALDEPKAGQILTRNIESGAEYKLGFTLDGVNAAQSGHNLLLTFKDGGVLVLNNYFTAVDSDLPPALTLANGSTIDANALLTSCKLVEIPDAAEAVLADIPPQTTIRESAPDIEPAAGDTPVRSNAPARGGEAPNVANIEPAAGDAGDQISSSSRGYGFGSSVDGASFAGRNAIGPIGATSLSYTAPSLQLVTLSGTEGTEPIDYKPSLDPAMSVEDESDIGSVSGNLNVDYGKDGAGFLVFNDSFTSSYALTSHGDPITVTHTGGTYTGVVNGEIAFTLVLDPVTGDYVFTQYKEIDHADPTDPDDSVNLVFGVTASDKDGDAVTSTITIVVHDDGPVAVDDGNFVSDKGLVVDGNVLSNDDAGADGLGHVTKVTFNGVDYAVPASGAVTVNGEYGVLKIAADGSYTYTSSNTALGTDTFTYTMVDYDGDASSANLSIEVCDLDTKPQVCDAYNAVDETDVASYGAQTVSGDIQADFGADGPGKFTAENSYQISGSLQNGALTSHGVAVVITLSGDTYIGKAGDVVVFTMTINQDGSYSYTQYAGFDHADGSNPNDAISLKFDVTASDSDDDSAATSVTITVYDDGPVAADDGAHVAEGSLTVNGNVLTNDNAGEDGLGHVTKVTFNGTDYTVPASGTVTVSGDYGVLKIAADGSFTYTSANTAVGTDNFTYTMVDYDGDASSANLSVEVTDVDHQPCIRDVCASIDETNIVPDGTESVSGKVPVDFNGDGPGTVDPNGKFSSGGSLKDGVLTSNGVPVVVAVSGNVYTGTANGKTVFTLTVNDDGSYTYTQVGALDHADTGNPDDVINLQFGVTATDADGDTAKATITIAVHDDGPCAVDDGAYVAEGSLTVNSNVLTNDNAGEDGLGHVTKVTFNGTDYTVPASGTVTVNGDYGVLKIAADGSYTYTSSNTALGTDKFTYTMVDYDGDASSANLSVEVKDIDCSPCVQDDCKVIDETDMAKDCKESVSGKVSVDFKGDGPGCVDPNGKFTSGGSVAGGCLTSAGVAVVVACSGNIYTGTANGKTVFTMTINDDGSYTYTQVAALDHADKTNPNDTIKLEFGFSATDADGDCANGTICVQVKDDGPCAVNDYATITSLPDTVYGNVTSNDFVGADKPGYVVTAVTYCGKTYDVPATGKLVIDAEHGVLTITSTGAYNYVGESVGTDCFGYKIADQDGDTSTAKLTLTVNAACDPLVVDLNGDGIHLTNADNGVMFDINADGVADKTAWTTGDDGFLALDKNQNGIIDNQSELFGDNKVDGFTVLASYDVNSDGVIDGSDDVWQDLKIWQDVNHDGITQSDELNGLDHYGISSISLDVQTVDYQIEGNDITAESTATTSTGEITISEAWFAYYDGADENQLHSSTSSHAIDAVVGVATDITVTDARQPVVITNFDASEGDKIDLSALIDNNDNDVTAAIQDFVFSRTENGNTIISVDASGSGSASAAIDVVVLQGVSCNQVEDIVQISQQQQNQSGLGTV